MNLDDEVLKKIESQIQDVSLTDKIIKDYKDENKIHTELQKAAYNLLEAMDNCLELSNKIYKELKQELLLQKNILTIKDDAKKSDVTDKVKNFVKDKVKDKRKQMELTEKMKVAIMETEEKFLKFQVIANNILEQSMKFVYVYQGRSTKTAPIIYEMDKDAFLKIMSIDSSLSTRIKPSKTYLDSLENNNEVQLQKVTNDNLNRIIDSSGEKLIDSLDNTTSTIVQRYRNAKTIINRINKENKERAEKDKNFKAEKLGGSLRVVLWKPDGRWKHQAVSSEGDIRETYAAFILGGILWERKTINIDGIKNLDIEKSIDFFMEKMYEQVDTANGFLQGDVELGKMEYAIKSWGASTQGLSQIKSLLLKIVKSTDDIDKAALEKFKKEAFEQRKLRAPIEKGLTGEIEEILASTIKDIEAGKL